MQKPIRVLHVDDSLLDIELVKDALEKNSTGFSVDSARSKEDFEQHIKENIYDVVISDFNILGFEGIRVLETIHEINPDIPVIIVTGTGSEEIAVEAMKKGAADYVIKHPSHIQRLPNTIYRSIEKCKIIEKQRESEELYKAAVENSNDGFALVKGTNHFFVNKKYLEIFGYDSMEEIEDKPPYFMVHPDDREMVFQYSLRRQKGEDAPSRYEYKGIRKDGAAVYIEVSATNAVYRGEQVVLAYLRDITNRRKSEEELKNTLEKLRKTLTGTIQAISLTVETRDPYTAGHQRRVSSLASSIAREMCLPEDIIDNIRMAGNVHDLGKISVPAEILSKPTTLTDIEYELIKIHSQSGYDILKDAELPFPIAETVLQHHERLDGSGYPQKLKDVQILLEAKIIAVADVVEAIATHRPYRPAKGIEPALEEIEKNKGILYDSKAAEACLKLFKDGRFKFE